MLYGNRAISHFTAGNIFIWFSMAFQAGLLNIGGFMACHRFVSHVTGFATFFGYELTQPEIGHAVSMLTVPFFFLLGAMISAHLVDLRLKLHKEPKYYLSFGTIFSLILCVSILGMCGVFGKFGEPFQTSRDYTLLALLCLICGMQNATISSASQSVIRTTHLTGITTDLGIGIVRILNRRKLKQKISNEGMANVVRVGLIVFFGLGSVFGGFAFSKFGYGGFVLPTVTSGTFFFLMSYFQLFKPIAAAPSQD